MTRRKGTDAGLAGLRRRLTERDFAIIDHLARHKVMTTAMLTMVFFTDRRRASARLLTLTELGVLSRTLLPGSGLWRYTLGWHGQVIWALEHGQRPPTKGAAELAAHQITFSSQLAHKEAVNAFFARLHHAGRSHGFRLTEWLSEADAAAEFNALRPDAAGTLTWDDGRRLRFWFEHDRGTETLTRLCAKLGRYPHRRSVHLAADRTVLIETCGPRRLAGLLDAGVDTGDLAAAAVLYEPIDPVTCTEPTSGHLVTERRWHRLNNPGPSVLLADLAE